MMMVVTVLVSDVLLLLFCLYEFSGELGLTVNATNDEPVRRPAPPPPPAPPPQGGGRAVVVRR